MNLHQLLSVLGDRTEIRISTEEGQLWIVVGKLSELDIPQYLIHRYVQSVYMSEGREANSNACELKPALCIVVEGYENGVY